MGNFQDIKWYNVRRELDDQEVTREMVKILANKNGWVLEYLDKKYLSDKEIVMVALKNNGSVLKIVDEQLRDDKEIVLTALNGNNFTALKYVSERLKRDDDVIGAAVRIYTGN